MCYKGFTRGAISEILRLGGAIGTVALAINYAAAAVSQWPLLAEWGERGAGAVTVFWGLLSVLFVCVQFLMRLIVRLIKPPASHWSLRAVGLLVGSVHGLWWSGVLLVALSSSGAVYLRNSVEERSILGRRLRPPSEMCLRWVADRLPGAAGRGDQLIPRLARSSG